MKYFDEFGNWFHGENAVSNFYVWWQALLLHVASSCQDSSDYNQPVYEVSIV